MLTAPLQYVYVVALRLRLTQQLHSAFMNMMFAPQALNKRVCEGDVECRGKAEHLYLIKLFVHIWIVTFSMLRGVGI